MTLFPPTPGMLQLQAMDRWRVLRRVRTGETSLNVPTFQWQTIAVIAGTVQPRSGSLRMVAPGFQAITQHQFFTQYRRGTDRQYVIKPKDVLMNTQTGEALLIDFVADEGGAHVYLSADVRTGMLNQLQNLAEQG